MKNREKYKKAVYSTLLYFAVSFFALCFIPIFSNSAREYRTIPNIVIGGVFWGFLALGFFSIKKAERVMSVLARKLKTRGKKIRPQRAGIVTFSSEPIHLVVYAVAVIGILLIIVDLIIDCFPSALMFPIISITLLAIVVHGVIDGKSYKTLKLYEKSLEDGHENNNE